MPPPCPDRMLPPCAALLALATGAVAVVRSLRPAPPEGFAAQAQPDKYGVLRAAFPGACLFVDNDDLGAKMKGTRDPACGALSGLPGGGRALLWSGGPSARVPECALVGAEHIVLDWGETLWHNDALNQSLVDLVRATALPWSVADFSRASYSDNAGKASEVLRRLSAGFAPPELARLRRVLVGGRDWRGGLEGGRPPPTQPGCAPCPGAAVVVPLLGPAAAPERPGSLSPSLPSASLPETPSNGVRVGDGPWRVTVSSDRSFHAVADVAELVRTGLASWDAAAQVLTWRPRYRPSEKGWLRYPANSSSCVWTSIPPVDLSGGKAGSVRFWMRVATPRALTGDDATYTKGSTKGLAGASPTLDVKEFTGKAGTGSIRNVGGTGDFRIALWSTTGADGSLAPQEKWSAYQFRAYPFLFEAAKKHTGVSDSSNASDWFRVRPGAEGCMTEDACQSLEDEERGGRSFTKFDKVAMGPNAPLDEWFPIGFDMSGFGTDKPRVRVSINGDQADRDLSKRLDKIRTSRGLVPYSRVDALSLGFNNMREYYKVEITLTDPAA